MATLRYTAVFLRFQAPLHLGELGVGAEGVQSRLAHAETLWAALVVAWVRLFGTPEPLAPPDPETLDTWHPPFLLSSAFPFVGQTLYFPRPRVRLQGPRVAGTPLAKPLKKLQFVAQPFFEQWIRQEPFTMEHLEKMIQDSERLQHRIRPYQEPHVFLGHAAFRSQIYYVGATSFSSEAGLFFLVDFSHTPPEIQERFSAALNLLAEEGLGGRRSYGMGRFTWHTQALPLQVPDPPHGFLLLSGLNPDPDFLKAAPLHRSSYTLYRSHGWALSPLTKDQAFRRPLWMFGEGSVFPVQPTGRLVEVTPHDWSAPHPLYRHGLAFAVPCRLPEVPHA